MIKDILRSLVKITESSHEVTKKESEKREVVGALFEAYRAFNGCSKFFSQVFLVHFTHEGVSKNKIVCG
jgi:hypothetical protein